MLVGWLFVNICALATSTHLVTSSQYSVHFASNQSVPYGSVISILKKFYFNSNSIFSNNFISISNFHFTESTYFNSKFHSLTVIPISILNSISSNNFYFNSYFNSNSICLSCCNTSYTTSEYVST